VRLYEAAGKECTCNISMPIIKADFSLKFTPHEIKTVKIAEDNNGVTVKEVNLLETEEI
jgi:hypothetical protein